MPETGIYVVTRYDDVRSLLLDPTTFSSEIGGFNIQDRSDMGEYLRYIEAHSFGNVASLQNIDPPQHARHRRLADQIFTASRVKALIPRIEEITNELIDRFIDKGECEFIEEFALPLPGTLLAEQLGLNRSDYPTFKRWVDARLAPATRKMTREELLENAEIVIEMQNFIAAAIEDRRRAPREDFLSFLVHAEVEGDEPLSTVELLSIVAQLMMAGFDTTTSALANSMKLLIDNPAQMAKLRADRSLMKGFVEEGLRHVSPVQGLVRRALKDTEIAGVAIPAGSVVMARYGAANHDAAKFACPHLFDIERKNASSHLAFGQGIHFCIGRLVARQEINSAFNILLDRMEGIELARPLADPTHEQNLILRALKSLPLRFRKAG